MLAQIGRDIADAQSALGIAIVGVWPDELLQRLSVLPIPAAIFVGDAPSVVAGMIMDGENCVAVGFGIVRL
jgi:hypothetical protein